MFSTVTGSARFQFLLVELLVQFQIVHSVGTEIIFPYLLPKPAASERSDAMMVGGDASARRVDVRLQFVPRGLIGRVLCGVLRLEQTAWTQIKHLCAIGADVCRTSDSSDVCVKLQLVHDDADDGGAICARYRERAAASVLSSPAPAPPSSASSPLSSRRWAPRRTSSSSTGAMAVAAAPTATRESSSR